MCGESWKFSRKSKNIAISVCKTKFRQLCSKNVEMSDFTHICCEFIDVFYLYPESFCVENLGFLTLVVSFRSCLGNKIFTRQWFPEQIFHIFLWENATKGGRGSFDGEKVSLSIGTIFMIHDTLGANKFPKISVYHRQHLPPTNRFAANQGHCHIFRQCDQLPSTVNKQINKSCFT